MTANTIMLLSEDALPIEDKFLFGLIIALGMLLNDVSQTRQYKYDQCLALYDVLNFSLASDLYEMPL